jgi:mannitol-1-/sugar-/sorbitol-6-phosphatase
MERQSIVVRAVLFDMDGVLISSIEADERSWFRWARLHGMQEDFPIQSTHGRRTVDTIRALRPDLDLTVELDRMEGFDAEDTLGVTVYPGVKELLARLSPAQWSIVTSASERVMRHRLGVLQVPLPLHIVTGDSVHHGKPDPEPYRIASAQLGIKPSECLVIEDAPSGIRAGKSAGCLVLAVASSHRAHELLEADWVIESLRDLELQTDEEGRIACRFRAHREPGNLDGERTAKNDKKPGS